MRDDKVLGSTVRIKFTTFNTAGAPVAPSSAFAAADFRIYKDGSASEKTSTNGITVTSPHDSVVGRHLIEIDTSNSTGDSGFWAAGSEYWVEINSAKTVDSQIQTGVEIGRFALVAAGVLRPTVDGRTLDVSAGGEAGIDWANVGSPTATLNLSGTTIATTQKVDVETIKTQALTASAGITFGVYVGGTGAAAVASTALSTATWTATIAGRIDAAISTRSSQTAVDDLPTNAELATALASADDATLAAIAAEAIKTSAIKAKTDNLPSDPADHSVIVAATDAILAAVGDVPTNSELATALAAADDATLAAIAAEAVKTAAIKAVTDKIDTGLVQDGAFYQFSANMLELGPSGGGGGGSGDASQTTLLAVKAVTDQFTFGSGGVVAELDSATAQQLDQMHDGLAWLLTERVGAVANPQNAAALCQLTIWGSDYSVQFADLTDTGVRGTTTLEKA